MNYVATVENASIKARIKWDENSIASKRQQIKSFEDLPNPTSIKEKQSELYSKHKPKECTFQPKLSEFIYSINSSTQTKKLIKRPKSAKTIKSEDIERF